MRDISALGSGTVLGLVIAITVSYLILQRKSRTALGVLAVSVGGTLLNFSLKAITSRPRPDIVPHLAEVDSSSFPSGHSMISAIIYLSLAALLARDISRPTTRVFVFATAAIFVFAIGITRVYLGVHYPSDVAAGWAAGVAWTLVCLLIQHLISRRLPAAAAQNE